MSILFFSRAKVSLMNAVRSAGGGGGGGNNYKLDNGKDGCLLYFIVLKSTS